MDERRAAAFERLNIPRDNKLIICLDGGGIRGILTLQLLKKLEAIAGMPVYELADMVAGTSTGGIITGLVGMRYNAEMIEEKYISLVSRVFIKRSVVAHRYINPPVYSKRVYRKLLKELIGDVTLKDICQQADLDILITAKDMAAGEETFFTCFKTPDGCKGTYQDVLLRGVMEATMSAPTYFYPLERFVDGGTTTYNNPSLAALMEATIYGDKDFYQAEKITVMSFGTGTTMTFIDPSKTLNPKGMDLAFWLNFVMGESSQDASAMQIDMLRSGFIKGLDYRRFQLSFDEETIKKLPNRKVGHLPGMNADWLWELTNPMLEGIDLDDVNKFHLVKEIGEAFVEYICPPGDSDKTKGNWFRADLVNERGRDMLVSAFGDVKRIQAQMSDPKWLDDFAG